MPPHSPRESILNVPIHLGFSFSPRVYVNLPNLKVTQIYSSFTDDSGQVTVSADVMNDGSAKAGPCWVMLTAVVFAQNQQTMQSPVYVPCPSLNPGQVERVEFPPIENVPFAGSITLTVVIDPPTPDHPGGLVWESDEGDNSLVRFFSLSPFTAKGPNLDEPPPL